MIMGNGTVLIVEDNPDDEALILRTLRKANLRNDIAIVRDGAEALDYLFQTGAYEGRIVTTPAIVLLDLKLPKVDGLEVLQRLRENERTGRLPVVVLTSSDEQEDIIRSYDLGANSYVRKPVEMGAFSEAVSRLGLYWLLLNEPPPECG
jgi:CheY-like chemotaxis protein